jgi:threonyl-tRNA synthetase
MHSLTPAAAAPALLDGAAVSAHPPSYSREAFESVAPEHLPPTTLRQRVAHRLILTIRTLFDKATGYDENTTLTEKQWLARCIILETVAGVPGMVGGALRHLQSLRMMKPDGGRINTLIDESENERMHLLTFLELRKPGKLFRAAVTVAQGVAWNLYFAAFLLSPRSCHAFVGYLEEQAVRTYTHLLEEMDAGHVFKDAPTPEVARVYWRLGQDATMRDVILAIRADEKAHAEVNHTLSLIEEDAPNPFVIGGSDGGSK